MIDLYRLQAIEAIEAIKQAKARYFRGVDTGDGALVRSVLAEDCVLDYRGCCTDPVSGVDYLPAMNVVLRGRDAWSSEGFARSGIVSVHQGGNFEVTFVSDTLAESICTMTDRLFMPAGAPFEQLTGHGYYHDTWEHDGDGWMLKALRIARLRVAAA